MDTTYTDEYAASPVVGVIVMVAIALIIGFVVWGGISYLVGVAAGALLNIDLAVVERFGVGLLVLLVLSVIGKFAKN